MTENKISESDNTRKQCALSEQQKSETRKKKEQCLRHLGVDKNIQRSYYWNIRKGGERVIWVEKVLQEIMAKIFKNLTKDIKLQIE